MNTKICTLCNNPFKLVAEIDGKRRNLCNRTKCLMCMPFGTSLYAKKDPKIRRTAAALASRKNWLKKKAQYGKDPHTVRREIRKKFFTELVGGCQFCQYNRLVQALDFHHLYDKKFGLSSTRAFQSHPQIVLREMVKCVVACSRCRTEIHHDLISEERVESEHQKFKAALEPYLGTMTWSELGLSV